MLLEPNVDLEELVPKPVDFLTQEQNHGVRFTVVYNGVVHDLFRPFNVSGREGWGRGGRGGMLEAAALLRNRIK